LLGLDDTLGNDPYLQVDKSGLLLHLNEAFQKFSVLHNDMKEKNVIVPMKSKVRFTIQWTVKHGSVSLYEEKLGKLRRDYEDAVGTLIEAYAPSSIYRRRESVGTGRGASDSREQRRGNRFGWEVYGRHLLAIRDEDYL
jgi:hypothetical protein